MDPSTGPPGPTFAIAVDDPGGDARRDRDSAQPAGVVPQPHAAGAQPQPPPSQRHGSQRQSVQPQAVQAQAFVVSVVFIVVSSRDGGIAVTRGSGFP